MKIEFNYGKEFDELWEGLKKKYPKKLFNLEGVGEQLDLKAFSKKFFSSDTTADSSVDANANVDDVSVIAYNTELPKPFFKLNSYYVLWDKMNKMYGKEIADRVIEMQLSGDIYIHDFHGIASGLSYSYHKGTSIVTRDKGGISFTTMGELFDEYASTSRELPDRETIDLREYGIEILDEGGEWARLEHVLRHRTEEEMVKLETKDGRCTIVTANHPVILENGSEKEAKDISIMDKLKKSGCEVPLTGEVSVGEVNAYFTGFMAGREGEKFRMKEEYLGCTFNDAVSRGLKGGEMTFYERNIVRSFLGEVCGDMFEKEILRDCALDRVVMEVRDIEEGSYSGRLPKDVLRWKREDLLFMIAGLVDSDGEVNRRNGMVRIKTGSFSVAQQVGEILRALEFEDVRTSLGCVNEVENSYERSKDVYKVSFKCKDKTLIRNSKKLNKNGWNIKSSDYKDKRLESSKINKIESLSESVEWVYDVTTSSQQFASQGLTQHNCFNYSTYDVMTKGLPMVKKIKSVPPKYLYAFKSQLEQFTVIASNSTLGATGLADLFIVMSYYMEKILKDRKDAHFNFQTEEDCWNYLKENLVSFIYTVNQPMRANQSLRYSEKIVVSGENIPIGKLVERYLDGEEMEKDIKERNVYTYSFDPGSGKFEEKRIKGVIKHKNENELVEYKLANGNKVVATDNHSFFMRDGLSIKVVDRVDEPNNLIIPFNFYKSENSYDYIMGVEDVGGRVSKEDIRLDEKWMYMLGHYLGDGGCYGDRCGGSLDIASCNKSKAESIYEDFRGEYTCRVSERGDVSLGFGMNINTAIEKLFGRRARGKRVPRYLYNANNIMHLVGGYLDSDGHVTDNSYILTSVNRELVQDIQFILMSRGILSTIHEYEHKGYGDNGTPTDMYQLAILANDCHKLNPYVRFNKFVEREIKYDYSSKYFDFDGMYKIIKERYDIYNPMFSLGISYASRDNRDCLQYKEICEIASLLSKNIKRVEKEDYGDNQELSELLCDTGHGRTARDPELIYNQEKIEERIKTLKELMGVMERFVTAPPIRIESINEVENEEFVYDISVEDNENFLTSSNIYAHNSPFTNVSVYDKYFLDKLASEYVFPDGNKVNTELVMKIQEMFLDIMNREMTRTAITFPIVSACISTSVDKSVMDEDFVRMIAEKNLEYGFINLFHGKTSVLSSCCRLRSDSDNDYFNSFGAGTTKIGSLGVTTINFPRLAIKHKGDREGFMTELEELTGICARINNAKREIVKKRINNGNLPLYTYGFAELDKQYSTVGVNGMNECVEIMGEDILKEGGQKLVVDIMKVINRENDKYQNEYEAPHNCEQVPGENMANKVAVKDRLLGYQDRYEIYSNQFIPLTTKADMLDRIKLQGLFDEHFSGGASCHINIETKIEDPEVMVEMIKVAAKMGVIFYSFNMNIQECGEGHFLAGKRESCGVCGSPIINDFTRVVGFLVNVKNWSRTRRELDYPNRQWYRVGFRKE